MIRQNNNPVGDPLDRYSELEIRPTRMNDNAFASEVLAGVHQRKRHRETRRHSLAVLTSVLLLVLTLQGQDSLRLLGVNRTDSTNSESIALAKADSMLDDLASSTLEEDVSSFIDYLNSDLPADPVAGLALYDDDAVDEALKQLANGSIFDMSSNQTDNQTSGKHAGLKEGV
ncbi:hypothetical protein KQI63_13435 [bacterium]|nr:hypothetical protein [bacterium]